MIQIGNPTLEITFKDLFGPNGSKIGPFSPKERLLSFLQEIFPEDHVSKIEYLQSTKAPNTPLTFFDIPIQSKCKCFNKKGDCIFDVEISRDPIFSFVQRTISYASYLLDSKFKQSASYSQIPQIRVLSLLYYIADVDEPSIYQGKIIDPESGEILDESLSWTFVQLPKILEEGTNKKWLQILSAGATPKELVSIDASKFNEGVHQSALTLLESYSSKENYPKLKDSFDAALNVERLTKSDFQRGKLETSYPMILLENRRIIQSVLNLAGQFPIKDIPEMLSIDTDVVYFIVLTYIFWKKYLKKQDQTDQTLEEEIKNFFNFPD